MTLRSQKQCSKYIIFCRKKTHTLWLHWFPVKYSSIVVVSVVFLTVSPPLFTVGNDLAAKITPVVCTASAVALCTHPHETKYQSVQRINAHVSS